MFEKKQIIYSETQGVCQVENIVSLSASRRERKIPYYVLRPVFDKSRVSYIPVENHQVKLRELFTREEAEALQGTEEMKKDEKLRQAVEYVLGKKEGTSFPRSQKWHFHRRIIHILRICPVAFAPYSMLSQIHSVV